MKRFGNYTISVVAALAFSTPLLAQEYSEAPELAELVAAGSLPPVEERLPANPLVVEPFEMVGSYGGVWRSALKGSYDTGWIRRTIGYQPLVAFNYDWDEIVPNVAERFEVNDDATEFTFYLREGHKWSDGEPFTAEDLDFALKVMSSPDYTGRKTNVPLAGATGEVVNETTFKIKLEQPNGLFLQRMATVEARSSLMLQSTTAANCFPKSTPDANAVALERGFENWSQAI